jgi:hypothetical protein
MGKILPEVIRLARRHSHKGGRVKFKKKSACKRGKPKHTACYKVKGGWKRRHVK